jgi:putative addiction module component (TIGR02574 family)
MQATLEQLMTQALALPPEQRAVLAEILWDSIDPESALSVAWNAEIRRRVAADAAGQTQYVPAQGALDWLGEHIQTRLAQRRW